MNKIQFIDELAKLRPSSTFIAVKGYRNEYGEIADYNLVFHFSYENALRKSIETLVKMDLKEPLETQARNELISSFTESLRKGASYPALEDRDPTYIYFDDIDGNPVKGIKMHKETGELYLYGLIMHKRVRMPGCYPAKNQKPATVAKNKLRYLTPVGKFRSFRINPNQVDLISVEHLSLLPPE